MPADATSSGLPLPTRHASLSPTADAPIDGDTVSGWWDWFVGTPLRIAVILLVGAAVLIALRGLIRGLTKHIAEGTPLFARGRLGDLRQSEVGSVLLRANPLATARRAQRARTIGSVLRSTVTIVIGTLVVLLVLAELDYDIAPFIASAGIVGVALGFGAQSLVKDFLSGTFMLLEDQYGIGDTVDFGTVTGTVEAVALRVTKVRDGEGTLWYIRNGEVLRIGNKTQGWARAVVEVRIDYDIDVERVRSLLAQAAAEVRADAAAAPDILEEPRVSGIEDLTGEAVVLKVTVKTQPGRQWDVARALRSAIRRGLDSAGIVLAGAQRIEVSQTGPGARGAEDEGPTAPARS